MQLLSYSTHWSRLPVQDELLGACKELHASPPMLSVSSLTLSLSPMCFPLHLLKQLCKQGCTYLYVTKILFTPAIIITIPRRKVTFLLVAIIGGKYCLRIALQDLDFSVTKNLHSWKDHSQAVMRKSVPSLYMRGFCHRTSKPEQEDLNQSISWNHMQKWKGILTERNKGLQATCDPLLCKEIDDTSKAIFYLHFGS